MSPQGLADLGRLGQSGLLRNKLLSLATGRRCSDEQAPQPTSIQFARIQSLGYRDEGEGLHGSAVTRAAVGLFDLARGPLVRFTLARTSATPLGLGGNRSATPVSAAWPVGAARRISLRSAPAPVGVNGQDALLLGGHGIAG